jgi:hypothetical protein
MVTLYFIDHAVAAGGYFFYLVTVSLRRDGSSKQL